MNDMHMIITLLSLAAAVVLLVSGAVRGDLVAMALVFVLMASGVLTPVQALSGFASNVVVIIAAMFVVGKAITHTGLAQRVGMGIVKYGGASESRLLVLIMLAAGLVGAFMSSTATVAVFIPIVLAVSEKADINPRRLLMPLSMAGMISGMMTLIATPPNIVMNGVLADNNLAELGFFSFSPFGIIVMVLAIIFMALVGQNMLAAKGSVKPRSKTPSINDILEYHQIAKYEYLFRVLPGSPLVGLSAASMHLAAEHHVTLLAVQSSERARRKVLPAWPGLNFRSGDVLLCVAAPEHARAFADQFALSASKPSQTDLRVFFQSVGVAEVLLKPESGAIGKSLRDTSFQFLYHCLVLGVRRKGETLTENLAEMPLSSGDVLLVCGAWPDILRIEQNRENYILLTLPRDFREVVARDKEPPALIILALMVLLMVTGALPPVAAIFGAAVALVLTGCVPKKSLYEVIDWQNVILIAGIMSLAVALREVGAVERATAVFFDLFANASPTLVLGGLFMFTAMFGLVMSNSAVTVLVAPVAIEVGLQFNISPQACAMMVAIACSSSFISPLGSPVHMIVREPGGYSFADYAKVGVPLLVLSLIVAMLLCNLLYL